MRTRWTSLENGSKLGLTAGRHDRSRALRGCGHPHRRRSQADVPRRPGQGGESASRRLEEEAMEFQLEGPGGESPRVRRVGEGKTRGHERAVRAGLGDRRGPGQAVGNSARAAIRSDEQVGRRAAMGDLLRIAAPNRQRDGRGIVSTATGGMGGCGRWRYVFAPTRQPARDRNEGEQEDHRARAARNVHGPNSPFRRRAPGSQSSLLARWSVTARRNRHASTAGRKTGCAKQGRCPRRVSIGSMTGGAYVQPPVERRIKILPGGAFDTDGGAAPEAADPPIAWGDSRASSASIARTASAPKSSLDLNTCILR